MLFALIRYGLPILFSGRRRHTRSKRDWSSDVCSSDLRRPPGASVRAALRMPQAVVDALDHLVGERVSELIGALVRLGARVRSEERRVGKAVSPPRRLCNAELAGPQILPY